MAYSMKPEDVVLALFEQTQEAPYDDQAKVWELLRDAETCVYDEGSGMFEIGRAKNDPAAETRELWSNEFIVNNLCGLCGNKGVIDTRGHTFSNAGIACGGKFFCICPNGRTLKHNEGT